MESTTFRCTFIVFTFCTRYQLPRKPFCDPLTSNFVLSSQASLLFLNYLQYRLPTSRGWKRLGMGVWRYNCQSTKSTVWWFLAQHNGLFARFISGDYTWYQLSAIFGILMCKLMEFSSGGFSLYQLFEYVTQLWDNLKGKLIPYILHSMQSVTQ